MKRLILMRHAKSDWSRGLADHDRPLNARGQRSASALGDWLRDQGIMPDQVLCSSATRTRETLAGLALRPEPQIDFTRALYLAPAGDILATLQNATGDCVLILGHNPGIAEMAQEIVIPSEEDDNFGHFPTGATLVADFEITTWAKVTWHSEISYLFITPRNLLPAG